MRNCLIQQRDFKFWSCHIERGLRAAHDEGRQAGIYPPVSDNAHRHGFSTSAKTPPVGSLT